MGQYLIQFAAYTFAMIGLITLCLLVYKKMFLNVGVNASPEFLKVENTLNLSARKTIYVIKAGEEKFLVASDVDKTTFLAKLNENSNVISIDKNVVQKASPLAGIRVDEELSPSKSNVHKLPVMKELMRKLNS